MNLFGSRRKGGPRVHKLSNPASAPAFNLIAGLRGLQMADLARAPCNFLSLGLGSQG